MKIISIITVIVGLSLNTSIAKESCLNPEKLKSLDASWEEAQLNSDVEFLESILAEDFIWVHNHANTIDTKTAVINRANKYKSSDTQNARSRKSMNVKVIVSGATGIVSGITIVDRGASPTTYHFMRTYVESNGKCLLIANQTMAVHEKE
jgi:ketosteroid isomerase-like protein